MSDSVLRRRPEPWMEGTGPASQRSGLRRSTAFAASATRLAGLAGALLGWRPDEFWRATPAELEAVLAAFATPPTAAGLLPDVATIAALKEQFPDG